MAQGLVALGRAVAAELAGDLEGAISALDAIPQGSMVGEWSAQALMVRGTNLLLGGRTEEAVAALHAATGEGSDGWHGRSPTTSWPPPGGTTATRSGRSVKPRRLSRWL